MKPRHKYDVNVNTLNISERQVSDFSDKTVCFKISSYSALLFGMK